MTSILPPQLVDDLFRHRYARMVAGLCRVLGPGRLDLVEDVVQEALLRALRVWPAEGVPDSPEAWVFRVARNLALDSLRRQKIAVRVESELRAWAQQEPTTAPAAEAITDDTLRMLFLCSHPAVPVDARVPLILKTVCGLGVPAIARGLLQKEATIAQRLVRAKAKLQGGDIVFEMPGPQELAARLDLVLQVVYLLFNEGYRSHDGPDLVRADLVHEAVRLTALLLESPAIATPTVHALLALMLLLGARVPARTDAAGDLLTLAEQDRSSWDRRWLACGFHHFQRSIGGDRLSPYHCEAAIASVHASAATYAATDWRRILAEYDRLLAMSPSPIVRLNRAVATGKVHGAAAALAELEALRDERALDDYFLLPATTAQMRWVLGEHEQAARSLEQALELPCSEPEQRLLARRLAACRRSEAAPPW
ncbi:MAG TPA: sigma-70 family RNA polymerase sigma factor [Planctomycetota bacterium]|nr:sigma-70 family RNA polymerase sigma factor [Planctomycetota bacterium]